MKTPAFLVVLALASTSAVAGESPYNPNAKPQTMPDMYYVCVAQSRDFTTRYVSPLGAEPKPFDRNTIGTISGAWMEYLAKTLGPTKTMNAHCTDGPQDGMQKYRDDEINGKRYRKVEQIDWKYASAS